MCASTRTSNRRNWRMKRIEINQYIIHVNNSKISNAISRFHTYIRGYFWLRRCIQFKCECLLTNINVLRFPRQDSGREMSAATDFQFRDQSNDESGQTSWLIFICCGCGVLSISQLIFFQWEEKKLNKHY